MRHLPALLIAALAGCAPPGGPDVSRFTEPLPVLQDARPDRDGACFASVQRAEPGAGGSNGGTGWIETPCDKARTPDFTASLQRALIARGLMEGPATGTEGPRTRAAIRAYQRGLGLDAEVLSLAAAKRLGLAVYERAELTGE